MSPASGGDPLVVVQEAQRRWKQGSGRGTYKASVLLIDTDRLDNGEERSLRAIAMASRVGLRLIRQRPKFEGVLLRLYPGHEGDFLSGTETDIRLRRLWSGYEKRRVTRYELSRRFTRTDLLRAAGCDEELRALVALLGL